MTQWTFQSILVPSFAEQLWVFYIMSSWFHILLSISLVWSEVVGPNHCYANKILIYRTVPNRSTPPNKSTPPFLIQNQRVDDRYDSVVGHKTKHWFFLTFTFTDVLSSIQLWFTFLLITLDCMVRFEKFKNWQNAENEGILIVDPRSGRLMGTIRYLVNHNFSNTCFWYDNYTLNCNQLVWYL